MAEENELVNKKYNILGRVGEGTYGVVCKASVKGKPERAFVAIKKFKAGTKKDGEGISLTACREIMLLREINHDNTINVVDVILNPIQRSLFLVFDYAEYDLYEIIKHHRETKRPLSEPAIKSYIWQMLNGIHYLHSNWILHRDLKPSNILVMGEGPEVGRIKIADFGLARIFQQPERSLAENGVVVTIWYRAPELLLSSNHYSRAIDVWALGCIFGELYTSKPLFSSSPATVDVQLESIYKVIGTPTLEQWPGMVNMPDYQKVQSAKYHANRLRSVLPQDMSPLAFDLLTKMIEYDPDKRLTALEAMEHRYFHTDPPSLNAFDSMDYIPYPKRE